MFEMRNLPSAAGCLELADVGQQVLAYVAEGLAPNEISERVDVPEDELYRLVAWVLDELEPAPGGDTMRDVYARHGGRRATSAKARRVPATLRAIAARRTARADPACRATSDGRSGLGAFARTASSRVRP
jgi:hypothetical protein